jgi:hypothetical protein
MKEYFKLFLYIFILISIIPLRSHSQNINDERPYIYFPKEIPEYKFNSSIGITIARLPRPVVEEELDQSPMLDFHLRFGLPYNLSLFGRINTIGITNHISAGFAWSFSINKFFLNLGNNTAYWLGWANFYDFDVRAGGIIDYPEISVGYDFDKVLLTLRTEAEYLVSMKRYSGTIQTKSNQSRMMGFSVGLFSEQLLRKKSWITLGFKLHYTRYFYQSWISFSTLDQWFWTPEINLSYNL